MKYKAVVFDMDGVILDSERVGRDIYLGRCREMGYTQMTNAIFETLLGKTKDEVLSILGVNGLKSNTAESMEYYLSQDTENPKLLIIEFNEEEKVANVTACV